jgi:Cytosol aminopeptidase family, N-terminal domain
MPYWFFLYAAVYTQYKSFIAIISKCNTGTTYTNIGATRCCTATLQEDKEAHASLSEAAAALDSHLGGALSALIEAEAFKGAPRSTAVTFLGSSSSAVRRVALVGLGKQAALKTAAFDGVGSSLAGLAKSTKCESLGLLLPEGVAGGAAVSKVRALTVPLQTTSM